MPTKQELQDLIQVLTPTEKRYYRLNADKNSTKGDKQFLRLFDAITKGDEWSESVNPSVTNGYLYNSILNSLNSFQEGSVPEKKIARLIDHSLILYKKGLPSQSLKHLSKAMKLAAGFEDHLQIQQICHIQRNVLASYKAISNSDLTMESVLETNLKAAQDAEVLARLRFVQYRFQAEVMAFSSIKDLKMDELRQLLDNSVISEITESSSVRAQLTALHIWSQFYLLKQDKKRGLEFGLKVFELSFANRDKLYDGGPLVIGSANNYMVRCHRANETAEIERVLNLLSELTFSEISVEVKRQEVYYTHLLGYYLEVGKFNDNEILDKVDRDLDLIGHKMNQAFLMLIFSLCSNYALFRNDLRSALKWINKFLMHDKNKALRKNIAIAKTYRLLIYHQQGKMDLVEKELLAFSHQDEVEYPMITKVINSFLAKELEHGNERFKNLRVFSKDLKELVDGNSEAEAFEFFPFDRWVDTLSVQ